MSLFDFTLKVVTTISCFAVKEFHSILFGIVADRSLTFIIQLRIDRIFLDDQSPLVTSNSLLQSNQHHPPNWSNLPADMICEIVDRLPNFKDIRAISAVCNPCVGWSEFFFFFGMFFMFKICVNGEREKERQIPLFDLFSLAFLCYFCFGRRETWNLSKNTYLPLILTEVGYELVMEGITSG